MKVTKTKSDVTHKNKAGYDVPAILNLSASHLKTEPVINVNRYIPFQVTPSSMSYTINEQNQWGWITLYVVTIVIAILLNLLFIVSSLCTKRPRTTGYYLLINLSIRDILVASLCVPFTLYYEIIKLDWDLGDEFCVAYRYFYYCFLFFLPLTLLFLAWHLFVENCKWNFAGEDGVVPRPWPHTIYIPLIWFFSAAFAVPTAFWSQVNDYNQDLYRNEEIAWRAKATSKVNILKLWLSPESFEFLKSVEKWKSYSAYVVNILKDPLFSFPGVHARHRIYLATRQ